MIRQDRRILEKGWEIGRKERDRKEEANNTRKPPPPPKKKNCQAIHTHHKYKIEHALLVEESQLCQNLPHNW